MGGAAGARAVGVLGWVALGGWRRARGGMGASRRVWRRRDGRRARWMGGARGRGDGDRSGWGLRPAGEAPREREGGAALRNFARGRDPTRGT